MKKTTRILAAVSCAALFTACSTSQTPKASLNSEIDSMSYALGLANTQGLRPYIVSRLGVDTTYIDEFVRGLNEGANSAEDKRKAAYFAGIQIGQQINNQIIKGVENEVFCGDTTQSISRDNFIAAFIEGVYGKSKYMTMDQAQDVAQSKMKELKARTLDKQYGENRTAGEKFMAEIAKKEGIRPLANGVYYEVITEGKGEIPADSDRVEVNYEGRLINDTVFDTNAKRQKPAKFRCNQVIPGWTEALTHMPVGSTWMVYIPQEQAYGERQAGKIPPFSALKFKIELVDIVKDGKAKSAKSAKKSATASTSAAKPAVE